MPIAVHARFVDTDQTSDFAYISQIETILCQIFQATDLSFTGKQLSSLGLADLDRKLMSEDGVGLDNSFTFNGGAKNGDC